MNIENRIKQKFKDYLNSSMRLNKAIKDCKDQQINNYLKQRLEKQPEWQKISWLVIGIVKNIQLPKCHTCGKTMLYSTIKFKSKYCSKECKFKNKEYLAFLKTVDHAKVEIQQKRKQTMLKKYGVENVSQLEQIKKKKCQTQKKNFGVSYSFQSKELKQKSKQTMQQKYGVDHISQAEEIKNIKRDKRTQLTYNNYFRFSKYVIPLFTYEDFVNKKDKIWKCQKCGKEFIQNRIYNTGHIKEKGMNCCPRCKDCYPFLYGESHGQNEVYKFIKTIYNGQIIQHDRDLIAPKEVDITLPQLKVAIEYNGLYWHALKDKNYHLEKLHLCEEKGYKLIQINENEWHLQQQIIKAKLKSIICNNIESIYARKCQIKQIETKQSIQFLNKNHIQGADQSSIKLGLYYQNELVALMTFCKPRFNKKYQWQLSRYATSKRVIGGAGKLLKYFKDHYNPKSIITYCDRRFSTGNMYQKIGFKLDHISQPNYIWIKENNDKIYYSRYKTQKHKLAKLLGEQNFNKDLSEVENMLNNGFLQLYDCGNLVYVMNKYIQI